MTFFKKKEYQDVEGYNRISRLIEDRQRELTEEGAMDDLDEEAVLLNREPVSRDRPSAVPDRPAQPVSGGPAQEERPLVASAPPPVVVTSPTLALTEERRIPFQPEPVQMPRMTVPELGAAAVQGSLIAAEAVWEGKLTSNGNVRVEGTIHGEVHSAGTLYVTANARIDGTIQARNIILAGEIEGQVSCDERLEILPGGSARGEVQTATLVVHEGAFIDSRFQMRQPQTAARR